MNSRMKMSQAHKVKIAQALRGRKQSPRHLAKLHEAKLASGCYRPVGAVRVDREGYVWVKVAHHLGERGNWKAKHRIVMEDLLGRPLLPDEHVHHLDDDPGNNEPDNLLLLSHVNHSRLNYTLRLLRKGGPPLLSALLKTLQARGLMRR